MISLKKIISVLLSMVIAVSSSGCLVSSALENKVTVDEFTAQTDNIYGRTKFYDKNGNDSELFSVNNGIRLSSQERLPEKYSSVDKNIVTSVKNQGVSSSCWAFSTVAAAETSLAKKNILSFNDSKNDFSEAHLVWFTHNSLCNDKNDGTYGDGTTCVNPYEQGGNFERTVATLSRGSGFAPDFEYPFSHNDLSLMGNYPDDDRYNSSYYLKNAYELPDNDRTSIKNAIMNYGSVTCAFNTANSFFNRGTDGYCSYQNKFTETNHQVLVVGWDDNFSASNFNSEMQPQNNGAWLIKNSAGTSFGDNGYFWLSYYDTSVSQFSCYDVCESMNYKNIYQYDGYGYSKMLAGKDGQGAPVNESSAMNVFKAKSKETVDAVSFYMTTPGTEYKIEVYTGVTYGAKNPLYNATLGCTQKGSAEYKGHYTVDLSENVLVEKGEAFAVVITVIAPTGSYAYLPVEGDSSFFDGVQTRNYASQFGQSYVRFGQGKSWSETSGADEKNNVCIKAFTSKAVSYKITDTDTFKTFANRVSKGETFSDEIVELCNDIDFTSVDFVQIGDFENYFEGTFLGKGFVLKNITGTFTDDFGGVFSLIGKNATVKNLGLENVNFESKAYSGLLCGKNEGKIIQCYCVGKISGTDYVGGLAGYNSGTMQFSYSLCECKAKSNSGILLGYDDTGSYKYCVASFDKNVLPCSNGGSRQIYSYELELFKNGKVAYELNRAMGQSEYIYKQSADYPVLTDNKDYELYKIELVDPVDFSDMCYYLTKNDNISDCVQRDYPDYKYNIFADRKLTTPFSGKIDSDKMLYFNKTLIKIVCKDSSPLKIKENVVISNSFVTVKTIKSGLLNDSLTFYTPEGEKMSDKDYVMTGTVIEFTDKEGKVSDRKTVSVSGDICADGIVDEFDSAFLIAYLNFDEMGVLSDAQLKSLDVNSDGIIDSADVIYTDLIIFDLL